MNNPDVRWQQWFVSYRKALSQLKEAVELSRQRPLSKLEKQGVIQTFEFTHELAWNVPKDFLEDQGNHRRLFPVVLKPAGRNAKLSRMNG
ncbi:MAG: nucleotidyltransferase substrate binding protein [Gammaproteobacteria bacterium]|nr:nucleotidyltransferase substrate binding protein [Gammaproteobacteria bacterium]